MRRLLRPRVPRRAGWTGPRDTDLCHATGHLLRPVPPPRWPYGLPDMHQDACNLHQGGLFCDCAASDASDGE